MKLSVLTLYNDLLGVKLVNPNENLLRTLDTWQIFDTRRSYTCLPQCYFRGVHTAYLDAYLVVMLCFKFVYAVFYGIYRWLFLASR